MSSRLRTQIILSLVLAGLQILLCTASGAEISFSREIAPVIATKCVTCHNAEKTKGGYRLDTFHWMQQPGKSKEAPIAPASPDRSHLFRLLTAKDPDDRMPQKDEALPEVQITLIENWIRQGARFDGGSTNQPLASLANENRRAKTPLRYNFAPPVFALAFGPEGQWLAANGYGEITIWNAADGKLLRRIAQMPQKVQALTYNPKADALLACGGTPGLSGELIVIEHPDNPKPRILANASDLFLDAIFSPDGKTIATTGTDNAIHLYQYPGGRERQTVQQHADWVNNIVFNHEGVRFASASRDRTCRVFSTATGELETTYTGHDGPVVAIAFSADDKTVYSAARDRKIHVWQVSDGKKTSEITGFEGEVLKLRVQEQRLFVCCADKLVYEYDSAGKEQRTYRGHNDWVYAFSMDAPRERFATGAFDGEIRIWNMQSGDLELVFHAAPGLGNAMLRQP